VDIEVTLLDTDGTPLPGAVYIIEDFPPHGHIARHGNQLSPSMPAPFEGAVSVKVAGGRDARGVMEVLVIYEVLTVREQQAKPSNTAIYGSSCGLPLVGMTLDGDEGLAGGCKENGYG
jgi:hypothetical protein